MVFKPRTLCCHTAIFKVMKVDEMAQRNHSFKPFKSDKEGEDRNIRLKKSMKRRQKQESVIL